MKPRSRRQFTLSVLDTAKQIQELYLQLKAVSDDLHALATAPSLENAAYTVYTINNVVSDKEYIIDSPFRLVGVNIVNTNGAKTNNFKASIAGAKATVSVTLDVTSTLVFQLLKE